MREVAYVIGYVRSFGSTYYIRVPKEIVQAKLIDPSKPLLVKLSPLEEKE